MPTLIFLPGAGGDPTFWRPVGDLLPSAWRRTYLSWPGLGDQPPDPRVNGFDDLVALVEAQLGDAPVDLLAQSMGGAVALRVALRHPAKVRRLVLAATSGGIDVGRLGASDWRPEYRAAFPRAASWIMDARVDLAAELPELAHPTLLLWSDADPISPLAVGQRLQSLLRSATLHLVRDGDHSFVRARAAEVAPVIARHLG